MKINYDEDTLLQLIGEIVEIKHDDLIKHMLPAEALDIKKAVDTFRYLESSLLSACRDRERADKQRENEELGHD